MPMTYGGPRHRGACSITETPTKRRKYAKKGLRTSNKALYAALLASEIAQAELEAHEEHAFRLACDLVKLKTRPFALLHLVYHSCHPRAKVS